MEILSCFLYFTELLLQAEDTNKLGWAAWPVFCLSYRRLLPHLEGKTGVEDIIFYSSNNPWQIMNASIRSLSNCFS